VLTPVLSFLSSDPLSLLGGSVAGDQSYYCVTLLSLFCVVTMSFRSLSYQMMWTHITTAMMLMSLSFTVSQISPHI